MRTILLAATALGALTSCQSATEKQRLEAEAQSGDLPNLAYTKIIAPIDGLAGFAIAQVGDLVGPSTGTLTTVSQIDPIKAVVSAGEQAFTDFVTRHPDPDERTKYLSTLKFELILSNGQIYPHKGTFYATDRNLDLRTGSIRYEVTFPNPGNILRPGQFGRVRFVADTKKGALVIPQEAVTELQGGYQVAVVGDDNKVSIRPVNNGPVVTYRAGQNFSEMPGDRHTVDENASKTESAKLLAVFVVDTDEKELTTPYEK